MAVSSSPLRKPDLILGFRGFMEGQYLPREADGLGFPPRFANSCTT